MTHPAPLFLRAGMLAASAALLAGCAYFNTYYNASTAYNDARTAHTKLLREHPDTTVALTAAITAGYDTAVSKSLQVLQEFPKHPRWHDDALLLMGRALFYKGELARAIRRLTQLIETFPLSPLVPQAYLYLGRAYLQDDNLNKAEEIFSLILNRYPEVNRSQEVSMLLAEIAVRREGRALAIELLEKARRTVKDEIQRMQVLLRIAELSMDLKAYDRAISLLKSCPRRKDASDILVRVDLTLVSCYLAIDSLNHAVSVIDAMLKNKAYVRYTARIMLKKGEVLSAMHRADEAIAVYQKITERYASDSLAGIAWYRLGIIHQKLKGNFEKARECYTKAVGLLKDPRLKEDAQTRLAAIDQLMRHWHRADSAAAAPATTAPPKKGVPKADSTLDAYHIAEIFWLRLDEPDSALRYYTALAADTDSVAADSVSKALFAAGWIALNLKRDSLQADSLFGRLLAAYPASSYSKAAQNAMGREVTVKTREDSAHDAFLASERMLVEGGDPLAVAQRDTAIYDSFPDTEYGLRALYAAAWLYDVVLEKNKSAYDLYQRLCDQHPKSLLCTREAKPRLQIVNDTLRVRQATAKAREREAARESGGAKPAADSARPPQVPPVEATDTPTPAVPPADSAKVPPAPDSAAATPAPDAPAPLRDRMRDRYRKMRMAQQPGTAPGDSNSILNPVSDPTQAPSP